MMNAEQLMRVCLELDQQWLTSRPSPWGEAAELVARLCRYAELADIRRDDFGDWKSVDLSPVRKSVSGRLSQPHVDAIRDKQEEPT
jgi:hypothetical protein